MATFFDVGSLTREELELISQRVYKKSVALDRNYASNKDHLMHFIESIAKKSENRDSFWNRLSRKLEEMPTTATPNSTMPSSSGPRDTEILAFFQGHLAKLQSLLANLIAKGSQRALIGKLTDALNITQRSSHVGNLNEAQMNLLREIHTSINAKREASALANSNNLSNYNGSSVGSSGLTVGSNNSRQRPALNQNCGLLYNQNSVPNGAPYNQNNSLGSSVYCQNNNMSKSSTFNQNSSSSVPLYNQNSVPVGSIHNQNSSSNVPLYNQNSSLHNQNNALRSQTYILNDVPRDQLYTQNNCVPSGSMYNPNGAQGGSMQNHSNTSRGHHGNQINSSEYQSNLQNGSAYSQNVHSNIPNGATYNHNNASNSTAYSRSNALNSTAYSQYAAPGGTRYIQSGIPSNLSYSQQTIHTNALAYSHSNAPSEGMYGRNNNSIAVHNQNSALINTSYAQSPASSTSNAAYNQSCTPIILQEQPGQVQLHTQTQAQVQVQLVQNQKDQFSTETTWVMDFYEKVHRLLAVVISLIAGTLSSDYPLLLGETFLLTAKFRLYSYALNHLYSLCMLMFYRLAQNQYKKSLLRSMLKREQKETLKSL